jgi:hypothetical protein
MRHFCICFKHMITINACPLALSSKSTNAIQTAAIQSNFIIDLVDLSTDAVNVTILSINFFAHSQPELLQSTSCAMEKTQIVVNLVFHLFIFTIGLKLILAPLSQRGFSFANCWFIEFASLFMRSGITAPRRSSGSIPFFSVFAGLFQNRIFAFGSALCAREWL